MTTKQQRKKIYSILKAKGKFDNVYYHLPFRMLKAVYKNV